MMYAWSENFVLPLSHDEVVHGKGSLVGKMAGDEWQKFANLRLLLGYMTGQPGKKLLFMGGEFGQRREWNHDVSLDWHLLEQPAHAGLRDWVRDLNALYQSEPALYERDADPAGFAWIDCNDAEQSLVSFLRIGRSEQDTFLVVCNFTPIPRTNYRVGIPPSARWEERLNSDADHLRRVRMGQPRRRGDGPSGDARLRQLRDAHPSPLSITFFKRIGTEPVP